MEKIKVAVIGCGTIANAAHIPSYMKNDTCEIKYFCDIIPERAQAAVEKYGCGTAITDYHVVCDDPEIQAVSICTPNRMHSIISCDMLRAGKNVLCEKPAARIYSEALEMQRVQHETGKVLNIGVVNRFNKSVNIIREKIQNGELGNVYHVVINKRAFRSIPGIGGAFTTKAIAGGGSLIDWGVHFLDIVMYCCNDPEPISASGRAFCELGKNIADYTYDYMWSEMTRDVNGTYDVDDSITAFVRTAGPTITINLAWAQNINEDENYIDFIGDKAGIRLDYGAGFKMYGAKDGKLYTEENPKDESDDMFQNELDRFLDCIRSGEKLPSHIDKAVITSRLMQGIYDSSEQNKEIVF